MVTVRQFSRGVSRTMRAIEQETRRARRQQQLHQQALMRQTLLDSSAEAFCAYESLIEHLTRCHQFRFSRRDWAVQAALPEPSIPIISHEREKSAATMEAQYEPNWLDNLFGSAKRKRASLREAIAQARKEDAMAYTAACERFSATLSEITFAKSILSLDATALIEAVRKHTNLDHSPIESLSIHAVKGRVIALVDALEIEDMPTESVSLLKSGKASYKNLTQRKILELHRDNICSSAIRVAAEFLSALPVDAVEVVIQIDLLDPGTGYIDPQPVLYARITAQALQAINLQMADAAAVADRLGAKFSWHWKNGFRPLNLTEFDLPDDLWLK